MDYSPPGSSVHGIFQARILEWVAYPFSRGSSQSRYQSQVSRNAGGFFFFFFFWIGGELLYSIVVVFAIHWHESATGIHVSPSPKTSLPPPFPSHPSGLSQCCSWILYCLSYQGSPKFLVKQFKINYSLFCPPKELFPTSLLGFPPPPHSLLELFILPLASH